MSDQETILERLHGIECQFAFQQETIETLSSEVSKQWTTIDQLTQKLQKMTDHIIATEGDMEKAGDEPPPPHY